jgi:hypothetical protein
MTSSFPWLWNCVTVGLMQGTHSTPYPYPFEGLRHWRNGGVKDPFSSCALADTAPILGITLAGRYGDSKILDTLYFNPPTCALH